MKIKDWLTQERWVQGGLAIDKHGMPINGIAELLQNISKDNIPNQCCLAGALYVCYSQDDVYKLVPQIARKIGNSIPNWNDAKERKFEDVKKLVEEMDI